MASEWKVFGWHSENEAMESIDPAELRIKSSRRTYVNSIVIRCMNDILLDFYDFFLSLRKTGADACNELLIP